ncbi:MAG: hypothetical protein ACRDBO_13585 [Lachnospiraceae bacterium]
MTAFIKKQGSAFYFNALSVVSGLVAMAAMVISSSISQSYALISFPLFVIGAAAGIFLIVIAVYAANRWGNYDYVSTLSVLAAVALFSAVIGGMIMNRVLLISGLFSWNSGNTLGWNVFYASVVSIACFVFSILLLIVGSFLKSIK